MPVKILNKPEVPAKAAPAKAPTAADLQKDGRRRNPTKRGYPAKVFAKLLDYVASGQDLTTACKNPGMPTPWTVRRRMEVDDVLADQYKRAQAIRLHGLADQLVRLPDEALEGITNVSAANRLTQTKLKQDAIEFLISKGLAEYRGGDVGEATQITLNIVNSPDAPPAAGTPATPYTPPGTPVLKIVGGADNG
jgi:hypothetical protein